MLNRRHKSILFLTLVLTGSSLLAGATLSEGFGLLMLGCALAWFVGSDTAKRAYDVSRQVPGKLWGTFRFMLWMALGGCLVASLAVASNFNAFIVCAAMSLFGIFIAPYRQFSTTGRAQKIIGWTLAVVAFLSAALGMGVLFEQVFKLTGDVAGHIGALTSIGIIALLVGMFWLVKGWKLLMAGITPAQAAETPIEGGHTEANPVGITLVYLFMFAGIAVLTLVLSLQAFSAFSDSTYPHPLAPVSQSTTPNSPLPALFGMMLLAWWPYACWKTVLQRQPNTTAGRLRLHKAVTVVVGVLFVVPLSIGMTFGVQNGHDRASTAEIEQGTKDLQAVAVRIGSIKNRDFKTTQDYIDAYSELEPLVSDFDNKLKRFDEVLAEGDKSDKSRGPLNIQRFYAKHQEWMTWDVKTFDLLHQDNQLTKRQIETIKEMANLPSEQQVAFWKSNVQPLLKQEDDIRVQIAAVMKAKPN